MARFALQYVPFRNPKRHPLQLKTAQNIAHFLPSLLQNIDCPSVIDAHKIPAYLRSEDFYFRIMQP